MVHIIIVGSGVFGLSSALHLLENGYTDITVLDRLDLRELKYSFLNGADTASADINKTFRAYYGPKEYYHKLALKAQGHFTEWDAKLRSTPQAELSRRFNIDEGRIYYSTGWLRVDDTPELTSDEKASLESFEKSGLRDREYVIDDPHDVERAKARGLAHKLDPFELNSGKNKYIKHATGVLDSTSGLLYASNACLYVNTLLREKGVRFITGEEHGHVTKIIENSDGRVTGVQTKDGIEHRGDLTILAAGPWSSTLLPELGGLSEAHSGNVVLIEVPAEERKIREKYSPENFPIFSWGLGEEREASKFAGFGVFPLTSNYIKIISRQKKYLNPTEISNGKIISTPLTSRSSPPESRLSKHIINQVKDCIRVFLPDLIPFGIAKTELLWYTDTINNDFLIDYVPNKKNLIIVTGGSGHGFKFLPVLGQFVVDIIEKRENEYTHIFKWRDPSKFHDINNLQHLKVGQSNYYDQDLADSSDFKFNEDDLKRPIDVK